ncbi:unnamed protein product [Adineta steineri]|uniref:Uncharacterized protein n=1 Tax=Adineta steineri TaxID=433720 RepID=A0A815T895_9BILA|nr:unnamed protein product [Adineta steineri]CAF1644785.1 unnamed protein product [Adineta steineri]
MSFYSIIFLFILLTILLSCNISNPPDLWLNIRHLSVDTISLAADDLKAYVSVSAKIANLVSFHTGVDVTIGRVRSTITVEKIVNQEVSGGPFTIVGDYQQNMTFTVSSRSLKMDI